MPNWKLGLGITEHIKGKAQGLARIQADYTADRCPFDHDTLQRMLVPDETVWEHLAAAKGSGIDVPSTGSFSLTISAGAWKGLVPRTALFAIHPSKESLWWVPRAYGYSSSPRSDGAAHGAWRSRFSSIYPKPEDFDDETRQKVADWVNQAVRNARLRWIAVSAVNEALKRLDSTGKVLATWPFLASLCSDPFWTNRFRAPPVRLNHYADLHLSHYVPKVNRDATEVLLTGAGLMEPWKADGSRIWSQLLCYNEVADTEDYAP